MKTKRASLFCLIEDGRDRLEKTYEFKRKVEAIKKDMKEKYSLILMNEKSWTKRLFIMIRREIEIRRRIREWSSLKNLYFGHRWKM